MIQNKVRFFQNKNKNTPTPASFRITFILDSFSCPGIQKDNPVRNNHHSNKICFDKHVMHISCKKKVF